MPLIITLKLKKKAKFKYSRKIDEIQKNIDLAGMFVVISNAKIDAKEMITIARQRDKCEKVFKKIKTHFDMKVPHIHNEHTFKGKMFINFLAANIVETYRFLISEYLNKKSSETTLTSLNELSKIIIYRSENQWHLKYGLTKKVKSILKYLGINETNVNVEIKKITLGV